MHCYNMQSTAVRRVLTKLMGYYVSPIQPQTNDAFTGLMYAVVNGKNEVVHLLLASGADPNIQSSTVSRVRVGNGTVEGLHHVPWPTPTTNQCITELLAV